MIVNKSKYIYICAGGGYKDMYGKLLNNGAWEGRGKRE
jgi:hypothetical protein